jgi:hypothetical protein
MVTQADVQDVDFVIQPAGWMSKVLINGKPMAGVYRVVITADVEGPTKIELHCYGRRNRPIAIKGQMVVDETVPTHRELYPPIWEPDHEYKPVACRKPGCTGFYEDMTAIGDPNRVYRCPVCYGA